MNVPVLNKGEFLYNVKLNVTLCELELITCNRWHKLRGKPWNPKLGYLYDIVYGLRKHDHKILYSARGLVPVFYKSICVTYSHVDEELHDDLIRHTWTVHKEGYATFTNCILNCEIYMHRYIMDFPDNNLVVDHIRWNRLDNRKCMLRACTFSENNKNMSRYSNKYI
jgi:hypothetical protein